MAKASRKQMKPRPAEFWRKHVDGWRASKLKQAEYCSRHKRSVGVALYSLVETAKAKRLEPQRHLHVLFVRLQGMKSDDERRGLLPQYLAA